MVLGSGTPGLVGAGQAGDYQRGKAVMSANARQRAAATRFLASQRLRVAANPRGGVAAGVVFIHPSRLCLGSSPECIFGTKS